MNHRKHPDINAEALGLANKRHVSVLTTTRKCPLNLSQKLVLSHLVYQKDHHTEVGTNGLAQATGSSFQTVESILSDLEQLGLVDENGFFKGFSEEQKETWFPECKKKQHLKMVHQQMANWPCFVRAKKSNLTSIQIGLYSYFLHCARTGFGTFDKSNHYLSKAVGCSKSSVANGLAQLKDCGLITVSQPLNIMFHRLTTEQLRWFADKPNNEKVTPTFSIGPRVKRESSVQVSRPKVQPVTPQNETYNLKMLTRRFAQELETGQEAAERYARQCIDKIGNQVSVYDDLFNEVRHLHGTERTAELRKEINKRSQK